MFSDMKPCCSVHGTNQRSSEHGLLQTARRTARNHFSTLTKGHETVGQQWLFWAFSEVKELMFKPRMRVEPAGRELRRPAAVLEVSDLHESDLQGYVHHAMGLPAALPISWVLSLLVPANPGTT
jgi:hypothetical protein